MGDGWAGRGAEGAPGHGRRLTARLASRLAARLAEVACPAPALRRLVRLGTRRDRRLAVSIVLTITWLAAWAALRTMDVLGVLPP